MAYETELVKLRARCKELGVEYEQAHYGEEEYRSESEEDEEDEVESYYDRMYANQRLFGRANYGDHW
jgi:hypothetical protein